MLRPSPNHGTQRLPNDDDDDDTYPVPLEGVSVALDRLIVLAIRAL